MVSKSNQHHLCLPTPPSTRVPKKKLKRKFQKLSFQGKGGEIRNPKKGDYMLVAIQNTITIGVEEKNYKLTVKATRPTIVSRKVVVNVTRSDPDAVAIWIDWDGEFVVEPLLAWYPCGDA
jgi:hypothetical protein